jgi:hypothetical protein
MPIGSMPSTMNQLEVNKKIASFAKSRNSLNIKRSNLPGGQTDAQSTLIRGQGRK